METERAEAPNGNRSVIEKAIVDKAIMDLLDNIEKGSYQWNKESHDAALAIGIPPHELERLVGDMIEKHMTVESTADKQKSPSGPIFPEEVVPNHANAVERKDLIESNVKTLKWAISKGRMVLKWCYLDEPGEKHTIDIPTDVTPEMMKSTDFADMLAVWSQQPDNSPANTILCQDGPSFHFQASGWEGTVDNNNRVTIQPIRIVNRLLDAIKSPIACNYTHWWSQRATNGLDTILDEAEAGNNLDEIPPANLRVLPVYQSSQYALESVPSRGILLLRYGVERFNHMVEGACNALLRVADGGRAYYQRIRGVPCVMPGFHLGQSYHATKPHWANKLWGSGRTELPGSEKISYEDHWMEPNEDRRTKTYQDASARAMIFAANEDFGHVLDEGRCCYASTNLGVGYTTHQIKEDRRKFHDRHTATTATTNPEHTTDIICHILRHNDMRDAHCEPYNQETVGCQHSVRFRLPVVVHSSLHVIVGPINRIMSSAKWIMYFSKYRPCRPKMFWLEEIH